MKKETAVGLFLCGALIATLVLLSYVGLLRFSHPRSAHYIVPLREAAGLVRRSEVRIAGVKVGFVESITLSGDTPYPVRITVALDPSCELYADACGCVRQDGMLGSRYLDLFPGTRSLKCAELGACLAPPSSRGGTVEDLFERMAEVSTELRAVAQTTRALIEAEETRAFIADMAVQMRDLSEQLALCMRFVRRAAPAVFHEADGVMGDVRTLIDRADILTAQLESGNGTLSKLIHDDTVYEQARTVGNRIISVVETVDHTALRVDGHNEWLLQNSLCPGACYNQKSYLSLLLEPPTKFFGLFGLVGTPCGTVEQWYVVNTPRTCDGTIKLRQELSPYLFNLQLGVRHPYGSLRLGLIESTVGAALDLATPWWRDTIKLESSLWAYDFRGRNRLCDDRPHLKWINRLFLTPSVCFVAGVDDFVSCRTRNVFVGAGISLDESTLEHLFSW
jgi:phospholipid/cholesterol/gamma-HCH transport system substrate-binding protein